MKMFIARFVNDDQGQDLIEYAILIGLITVGVIGFITTIGTWVQTQFETLDGELNG